MVPANIPSPGAGYLLIVDYGDVEPDIWLRGRAGSLKTYGPGGMGHDPLEEPGRQDITADVNLSALARAAEAAGFVPQPLTTQRAWLLSLGLGQIAEELDLAGFAAALEGWQEQAVVIQGELSLVLKLVAEGGLGDLLVFRAAKAAPPLPAGGGGGG
jgi:SAM-dependent MidA family methyltransferase